FNVSASSGDTSRRRRQHSVRTAFPNCRFWPRMSSANWASRPCQALIQCKGEGPLETEGGLGVSSEAILASSSLSCLRTRRRQRDKGATKARLLKPLLCPHPSCHSL